jgi:hypothetical protein
MEVDTAAAIVPEVAAATPSPAPAPQAPETVAPVLADNRATDAAPVAEVTPPAPATDAEPKSADAAPVPAKSLLDKFDDKNAPPADAPKADDKPAEEVKAEPVPEAPKPADPAPELETPPVEEPVKLDPIEWFAEETGLKIPEVIALDDASKGKLTTALELGRTDPKAGAQALLDMHAEVLDQYAADLHAKMWSTFAETRKGWETKVMADPELGGAGHDTAMGRSARMRDAFVSHHERGTPGYEADQADWKDFMEATGAGDHPAFHRLMNNVARKFDEGRAPPPDPKPPKDLGRKPGTKGLNYSHPTSQGGN